MAQTRLNTPFKSLGSLGIINDNLLKIDTFNFSVFAFKMFSEYLPLGPVVIYNTNYGRNQWEAANNTFCISIKISIT